MPVYEFFIRRGGTVVIAKVDFMFIYVNRSIFLQEANTYVFVQAVVSLKYSLYLYQRSLKEEILSLCFCH